MAVEKMTFSVFQKEKIHNRKVAKTLSGAKSRLVFEEGCHNYKDPESTKD